MVKNITLSMDASLLQKARKRATEHGKSLNSLFREWMERYVNQAHRSINYQELMKNLRHVKAGQNFSRDERNER